MDILPLKGVRVIDLSWIIAGPTATRFMAMMGAEVIKVGSARRPDPATRGAAFQVYNQSKLYSSLNISDPQGLDLAKRLIVTADVLVENFAAGVIERLGLGYEMIKAERPDIIMVSSSGTGHFGPDKDYVAYGSLLQYYTGWNSISGYPNREPIKGGLWADPWVGTELAMITVAALNHRIMTGEGQYIDFSMAEALTAGIPEALIDYQMSGQVRQPMGNSDHIYSPHNVYRCRGYDRWIAIAVTTDEEWCALCRTIDRPDLESDTDLRTAEGRRNNEEKIDIAITEWTVLCDDYEAMHVLQSRGVPAGPSLNADDVFNEPHLRKNGYFTTILTNDGSYRDMPGLGWRFDGGDGLYITAAPELGQHNSRIYHELLGLPESEIDRLIAKQIIY